MQTYYHASVKEVSDGKYGFYVYRVTLSTASEDGREAFGTVEFPGLDAAEEVANLFRNHGPAVIALVSGFEPAGE